MCREDPLVVYSGRVNTSGGIIRGATFHVREDARGSEDRRFINLFLVALLDLSASVYTAVQKPKHEVFEPVMPVFVTLVIASGLLVLFLMRRQLKSLAFALTLVGVLCTVALMISTVLFNVPINAEIIDVWSVESPPANWAEVRDRWNFFHGLRTILAVVALACLLLAGLEIVPAGKGEKRVA